MLQKARAPGGVWGSCDKSHRLTITAVAVLAAVSIKNHLLGAILFPIKVLCVREKVQCTLVLSVCCVQSIWLLPASSLKFCSSSYVVKCLLLQRKISRNFVESKHKIKCVTIGIMFTKFYPSLGIASCWIQLFAKGRNALFIKKFCLFLRYPAVTEWSFLEALKRIKSFLYSCNCCKCKACFIDWVFCNCKTYRKNDF